MKRFCKYLVILCLIILPFVSMGCSCGGKYNSEDIANLYKTTVENQIDGDTGINTMFSTDYTIYIDYAPIIKNTEASTDASNNELNLYALHSIYNDLFRVTFRYYEHWQENFMEHADESLSASEFNELYSRLNELNTSLLTLKDAKVELEEMLTEYSVNEAPAYIINEYTYKLNMVLEKSLNFVTYFRSVHMLKIFTEETISANAVSRTLDDMLLSFAQFVYIDNIQPFNIVRGDNSICDLSLLVKAYKEGNQYVKLDYIDDFETELSQSMRELIDSGIDANVLKLADQYMYYSHILRQNILTLNNLTDNINYYKLCMYRFGAIDGGIEVYRSTITTTEESTYLFLSKLEDFMLDKYIPTLIDLTV